VVMLATAVLANIVVTFTMFGAAIRCCPVYLIFIEYFDIYLAIAGEVGGVNVAV
jgi:hypothetical protein